MIKKCPQKQELVVFADRLLKNWKKEAGFND